MTWHAVIYTVSIAVGVVAIIGALAYNIYESNERKHAHNERKHARSKSPRRYESYNDTKPSHNQRPSNPGDADPESAKKGNLRPGTRRDTDSSSANTGMKHRKTESSASAKEDNSSPVNSRDTDNGSANIGVKHRISVSSAATEKNVLPKGEINLTTTSQASISISPVPFMLSEFISNSSGSESSRVCSVVSDISSDVSSVDIPDNISFTSTINSAISDDCCDSKILAWSEMSANEKSIAKCFACEENVSTLTIPCEHLYMCDGCAKVFYSIYKKCPLCVRGIDGYENIYQ